MGEPIPIGVSMENTMSIRTYLAITGSAVMMAWLSAAPAHALSSKECGVKYEAARSAGTLNGMNRKAFRTSECGPDAVAAAPSTTAGSAPATSAGAAAAPAATSAARSRNPVVHTAASIDCSKQADAQGLHGKARKSFRSKCKAGDNPSSSAGNTSQTH
jgi:hypothetical protein